MQRHVTSSIIAGAATCMLVAGLAGCAKKEAPEALIAQARQSADSGDHKRALILLKNALEQQPDNGEARYLLAKAEIETGDAPAAEKELQRASELHYSGAPMLPLQVRSLMMQNKFDAALELLKKQPDSADILGMRGNALLSMGKADEARQAFEAALLLKPDDAEALTGMARHAALKRDLGGAEKWLDQALSKDGKNVSAWNFRGDLMQAQRKSEQALASYQEVLKLKPDHRSANLDAAFVYMDEGKLDQAAHALDEARKITPGNNAIIYAQGVLESQKGNYPAARDLFLEVLKSSPNHIPSTQQLGIAELNLGQLKPAEQHLKLALEAQPENLHVRTLLAIAQMRGEQPAVALATLTPVLNDKQGNATVLTTAGEAALSAGQPAKASGYFARAVQLAPDVSALYTSLGMSLYAEGKREQALVQLRRGVEVGKNSGAAVLPLVGVLMGVGQYKEALSALAPLEAKDANNALLHKLKGEIHRGLNDPAQARASLERAMQLKPDYYEAAALLTQLDQDAGKGEQGRARLAALLKTQAQDVRIYLSLAVSANIDGQRELATTWLEKAVAAVPASASAAQALGAQYVLTRQPQKAVVLMRKQIIASPENSSLLDVLGRAQLASGDPQGALETFSKLAGLEPRSAVAQFRLAEVRLQMNNPGAALESLKKAQELDPSYLPPYLTQFEMAAQKGDGDAALAVARRVQALPGQGVAGYVLEGDVQMRINKPALAFAAYQKAYSTNPTPQLLIKQAQALRAAGKEAQADQLVASWRQSRPRDSTVAIYVAEQQTASRQYDAAAATLEQVLKAEPNNAVALNNLAYVYQTKKDGRALATAEAAYRQAGQAPAVMDTLGYVLVERGDTARGLALLRQASSLAPNNPDIRFHVAWALHKSGDGAGAKKELEQLLAKGTKFSLEEEAKTLLKQL